MIIVNKASQKTPVIYIYGYIGEDVVSGDFVRELRSLEKDHKVIQIRFNTGGGSIFDGMAMYNAIKSSPAQIDGYIDGLAASMGSVLALACTNVFMSKYAMIMTHKPSGASSGSSASMRTTANVMDAMEVAITNIYAEKTGLSPAAAAEKYLGKEDRWIDADQAMNEKIIDGIYDGDPVDMTGIKMRNQKEVVGIYNSALKYHLINSNMTEIKLTAEQAGKLQLRAGYTPDEANLAISNLIAKAEKVDELTNQINTMNATILAEKVTRILNKAVEDKKITVEMKAQFAEDYSTNPDGLEKLIGSFPSYVPLSQKLNAGASERIDQLKNKSWDELDKEGLLTELKNLDIEAFKAKYLSKFNQEWKG